MPTIAVIVYDAVNPFELGVATEVFGFERPELGVPWYRFLICADESRPVRTSAGIFLTTPYSFEHVDEADTIIVPGSRPGIVPVSEALLDTLRRSYQRGARIITLCTGTFLLAAAGLLDGRCVTTHWAWAAELAERYPRVQVDPHRLYIDDGQILTSAGTAAAIDLSLHVVRQDYDAEIAAAIARRMVVPPHRDGGQAQYIETPLLSAPDKGEPFGATLAWIAAHLHEDLTVEQMAARAVMSPRTFARHFRATLGTTPYQWLLQQRIVQLNACWKLPTRPLSEWLRAVVSVQQPRFACTFNASCIPHHRCIATPFTARTEEKDRQNASKRTLAVTYAKSIAMPFPRH